MKLWTATLLFVAVCSVWGKLPHCGGLLVLDKHTIKAHLHDHLTMLTRTIGERSVRIPGNIEVTAAYIQAQFEDYGLNVERQTYSYKGASVSNVVAKMQSSADPSAHYVLGAHYDSVSGTVGADDNASSVAVLLEIARVLQYTEVSPKLTFVAFALEEPPAYGTKYMGSRVFANNAKEQDIAIDGMICLEMVGYTCSEPGCQKYPFPLQFLGYPKDGTFIGIVGNMASMGFNRMLRKSFSRNPNLPVVSLTVPFNGWIMPSVRLSDHASFWNEGYRAVMLTDSSFYRNHHYHLPSDTMDTLDFGYMTELVVCLVDFFRSAN